MISTQMLLAFFSITFASVQASKVLAAISGLHLLVGQIFLPLLPYSWNLLQRKEYKQIKLHAGILAAQILLALLHYFFLDLQLNAYTFFFFFTPHYFLCFKNLFSKCSSSILEDSLAIAIIATFTLAVISIYFSPKTISLDSFVAMAENFFSRKANLQRWTLLFKMNFSQHLFGTPELTLEAVAMTVFPLSFLSICFIKNWKSSRIGKFAVAASIMFLLMKNSRGELMFVVVLLAYPIMKFVCRHFKAASLGFIGFGFIQLVMAGKALNGRQFLNKLFLENITAFGKGIGFSSTEIRRITDNNYSSFHNGHFEIITNFGLIAYLMILGALYYFILRGPYNKAKHLILSIYLILLSTNFEVFDIYFCVPVAFALAYKEESAPTSSQP